MQTDDVMAADGWLEELCEPHRAEIEQRLLTLHLDVDDRFVLARDAKLDRALRELLRLVFATVPDGCEVYLAADRCQAAVARVGIGQVTLRWQIAGPAEPPPIGSEARVVPIHPIPADADGIVGGSAATATRAAFEAADWVLQLESVPNGRELIAHAVRA